MADRDIINRLDRGLNRMNKQAAKTIREDTQLPQTTYRTDHPENPTYVNAIHCGDGIIIVLDRFAAEDHAWSGHAFDQEILDELVEAGHLLRDE